MNSALSRKNMQALMRSAIDYAGNHKALLISSTVLASVGITLIMLVKTMVARTSNKKQLISQKDVTVSPTNYERPHKTAIVGANGGTGFWLVAVGTMNPQQQITACVKSKELFETRISTSLDFDETLKSKLQIASCDIFSKSLLLSCLAGNDTVVVSVIPDWPFKNVSIFSQGIRNIVETIRELRKGGNSAPQRLIVIGSGGMEKDKMKLWKMGSPLLYLLFLKPFMMQEIYDDMIRMEEYLKKEVSDVAWTIVRAPALSNDALKGYYRTSLEGLIRRRDAPLPRADLACYLLSILEDKTTFNTTTWVA